MGKTAVNQRAFYQASVNAKTVAATSVVDSVSGKRILVTRAWLEPTDLTGGPTTVTLTLGSNATSYDNLMTAKTVTLKVNELSQLILGTATPNGRWAIVDISSTGLNINITTGASSTTCVVTVWIEGVIQP